MNEWIHLYTHGSIPHTEEGVPSSAPKTPTPGLHRLTVIWASYLPELMEGWDFVLLILQPVPNTVPGMWQAPNDLLNN